jgi:serine protease Do
VKSLQQADQKNVTLPTRRFPEPVEMVEELDGCFVIPPRRLSRFSKLFVEPADVSRQRCGSHETPSAMENVVMLTNSQWKKGSLAAIAAGVCLLAATAVSLAQREPALVAPGAIAAQAPAEVNAAVADARQLSLAFRSVAKASLPGVVTIQVRHQPVRSTRDDGPDAFEANPFGGFPFEGSPLGDLLRSEPRMREFFRNLPRQESRPRVGEGSGFVIDPSGIIMTNNHVVDGASQITVRMHNGREYTATDVKADARTDVALIRISPEEPLTALPLGDSDAMDIGDWVLAVGSPFGQELTVTAGIISGKGRGPGITDREEFLQTDAAINPGNSGGPLLNLNGEVIGMNTAIATRSGGYDGVGYAVPVNLARWVGEQLKTNGSVTRAYLGAQIQRLNDGLARQFNVPVGTGALVVVVVPNSPAERAGLKSGDLIISVAGRPVNDVLSLQSLVEVQPLGQSYVVTVIRDGREIQISVMAEAMPADYSLRSSPRQTRGRGDPSEQVDTHENKELGMTVKSITPELAEQLSVTPSAGVLVTEVVNGSPADLSGISAGSVIETVAGKPVKSAREFAEAVKAQSLEKGVVMLIRSPGGRQHFVAVRVTEPAPTLRPPSTPRR